MGISLADGRSEELVRRFHELSPREEQVLQAVMDGHSAQSIAVLLDSSVPTVRTQIQAVLRKLGVHSQLEAASLAFRNGWSGNARAGNDLGANRTGGAHRHGGDSNHRRQD